MLHDDIIKWKHFPRYWHFVQGIHRSPVNSPNKGQGRGALMFYLICAWINGWVNNREASDLTRHRTHYDVIIMWYFLLQRPIKTNGSLFLMGTDTMKWPYWEERMLFCRNIQQQRNIFNQIIAFSKLSSLGLPLFWAGKCFVSCHVKIRSYVYWRITAKHYGHQCGYILFSWWLLFPLAKAIWCCQQGCRSSLCPMQIYLSRGTRKLEPKIVNQNIDY